MPMPETPEELAAAVRTADDKERLIGLLAAPLAAGIGLVVISALIANDPPQRLKSGRVNPAYVSVGLYHEVLIVLLALALGMLVAALLRKRLFMGLTMALYGLAVFNLHYWGFGIPFLIAGAWYLVRSYRLQRALREATGDAPRRPASGGGRAAPGGSGPRANKRYTPPRPPRRPSRPQRGESDRDKRAG